MKATAKFGICAAVAISLLGMARSASAGAVLTSGPVSIGVNDGGSLIESAGGPFVGLFFAGVGDALTPGCFCESWGASAGAVSGSEYAGSPSNVTIDSFGSTATTATSVVHLTSLPDFEITQAFAPSAGAPTVLFENAVTLKNLGAGTLSDVRYGRGMDWDVPPTEFSEFVTISGLPATNLLSSSDDGFSTADPLGATFDLAGCGVTANFTDCGPSDHGARFIFGFGDLAAGESKKFSIFYGAAENEADALAALASVGAEIFSFGQSSGADGARLGTPATYIFGFKGVGGRPIGDEPGTPVIPEPGSMMLLGSGLLGMAWTRRKRA